METNMGNLEKKLETNMGNLDKNMGNVEKKLEESMETNMGNMEKKMEKLQESMEIIVNLIQHPEEKLHNDDKVGQGTYDERNSSHFEKPSFSKSTLEDLILTLEVIRDGSQGVFNFPRLT